MPIKTGRSHCCQGTAAGWEDSDPAFNQGEIFSFLILYISFKVSSENIETDKDCLLVLLLQDKIGYLNLSIIDYVTVEE